jgi:hypothetical protein
VKFLFLSLSPGAGAHKYGLRVSPGIIRKTMEFFFGQVPSIVTLIAEPLDHAYRRAHVGKKPH